MSSLSRTGVLCALAVAFAGSVFAQPPGQLKKAPNQAVPTGQHDEPADPQPRIGLGSLTTRLTAYSRTSGQITSVRACAGSAISLGWSTYDSQGPAPSSYPGWAWIQSWRSS